ncbi:uncharacterized protein LOC106458357 [Limulus polyphemus]|uniref:Uncharacterized protein LOC106458357 n=1 Tax=Limulus polyphemus TaxID=6850 RepID=A0ABM1B292_LIMPO|nr:uncharacterized protein LOC106458357 [Limulus polyphemus]
MLETMADVNDSSLVFFMKATPAQWDYALSLYKEVLKLKAAKRTTKKGPEELINLDTWYQEQLQKIILSRKDPHIILEELIQITKWKLIRGKFRPRLMDLVKINTETAVKKTSKKAFRKLPKISDAITALTTLKGVGPATASAILSAGYPEQVAFMADESMLSTPGVEATDYTLAEYLNYHEQIKNCSERLNKKNPEGKWTPHKVELTLWTHYLAREMKPSLLEGMPKADLEKDPIAPNGKSNSLEHNKQPDDETSTDAVTEKERDDNSKELGDYSHDLKVSSSHTVGTGLVKSEDSNLDSSLLSEGTEEKIKNNEIEVPEEPASKKVRVQ